MKAKDLRAAVVGASTLLGKEVAEQVATAEPGWSLALLDEETSAGQMTAAGDEALFIQPLVPGALGGFDMVFFASDAGTATTHWPEVERSGAVAVDLTGGLEGKPGIVFLSPWLEPGKGQSGLDLAVKGIVAVHPAALMLALIAARLPGSLGMKKLIATVLQPASHYGKAALDELQAQTTALLTFQPIPRVVFDAQSAFNLLAGFGPDAKADLLAEAARVRRQFAALVPGAALELQLIQAPVFHGISASVFVEVEGTTELRKVGQALECAHIHVLSDDEEPASGKDASEQDHILLTLRSLSGASGSEAPSGEVSCEGAGTEGVWMWMAADNVRLAARHAVACAVELARLRPTGRVQ